jgi:hypothetical protein
MRNLLDRFLPLREGEGLGTGSGAGAGQGAGAAGAAGGAGAGDAGGFTLPDGVPEQFRGATPGETFGKLLAGFNETNQRFIGLRDKLATMPKAPDSPDKYSYTPSEKIAPYLGDLSKDPAFAAARNAFHKHGISNEAFSGIIEDLYGPLIEGGNIARPFDPAGELKNFMELGSMDRTAAAQALTNSEAFAKGLTAQLKDVPEKIKPEVDALLMSMTDTAAGNFLLRAISGRLAETGIRIGGESSLQGELTEGDLKKLDADPRIDPQNREHPDPTKRFDEELRKRYDAAYAKLSEKKPAF